MAQSTLDDYQDSGCIDHTDAETLRRLYWDEGLTLKEIANRSQVGLSTVHYHMDKHGIGTRGRAEHQRNRHAGLVMTHDGYIRWHSCDPDGKGRRIGVHRLLAVSMYGIEAVKGKHPHHKNKIPWDNRPSNIEILDPIDHGVHHNRGESNPRAKLTEVEVREINQLIERGDLTHSEIAERYGVTRTQIGNIENGKSWGDLTGRKINQ